MSSQGVKECFLVSVALLTRQLVPFQLPLIHKLMKKIIIMLSAIILSVGMLSAQEKKVDRIVRMDTINVDYKTRFVSNSVWDNIYIQGAYAARLLMSSGDAEMSFGKRLSSGFSISLGKQLHPDYGIRLSFGGMRLNGWTKSSDGIFADNDGWYQNVDPVEEYWKGQGVNTENGYRRDLKYFEVDADFMVDLYNIFTSSNRLDRRWKAEGYVGIGYLRAMQWHGVEDNNKVSLRLGLRGEYNFNKRLGLNLELGTQLTDASFTGGIGKGRNFCGISSATIGLRYNIGNHGFKVVRLIPQSQLAALNNSVSAVSTMTYVESDSIMSSSPREAGTLLIPSVVFAAGKDEYNAELQDLNIFRVARYMMMYKNIKVAVVGNTGGASERLARRRAEKIKDVLVNKYGIYPQRLVVRTYDVNAKYNTSGYEESVNFTIAE